MFVHPARLTETLEKLRADRSDLLSYVEEMCDRVDTIDLHVAALLPEPGRRSRLRAEAIELQARFAGQMDRLPLYGALVAVKDIIHVSGFVTRAGSAVPPQLFAGSEATCVRRLRDAGALILGKSVTTEFAYFEPGPTRNPHNLSHTPGGSSSGSAAAVAAGICPLAVGSQTIGSVIRPAAFCGIVGFKPSLHRIPSDGVVYFSRTVDHIGLFTQDVESMSLAAAVLCQDWRPTPAPETLPVLGVPRGPYLEQAEPEALEAFERHLSKLERLGCSIKDVPSLADIDQLNRMHRRMIFAEFAQEHGTIYPKHASRYRPRTAEIIEIGKEISQEELATARANCLRLRAELAAQMSQAGVDLWVSPSAPGPAPSGIHNTGDPNLNLPWTHAGMPVITLPAGRAENGLPLGLQLAGSFGKDEYLMKSCRMLSDRMSDMISE